MRRREERIGRPRVPPLPQAIVMEDRATATEYLLTHEGEAGSLTLVLSTTLWTRPDVKHYGPYDGPYVGQNVRLYVSGGTLSAEFGAGGRHGSFSNQRVLTRKAYERTMIEISVPDDWQEGDALTQTEITV